MEASAMGVPCVVTDIRGCREAVEHNQNGLLVPLGEVATLAQAIIDLLTNPARAQQMGVVGRQIAEKRFDEQLVFAKVKAEYARLLVEKGLAQDAGE
jgi:glycosyltransferase involved in cell wall biosynthesis